MTNDPLSVIDLSQKSGPAHCSLLPGTIQPESNALRLSSKVKIEKSSPNIDQRTIQSFGDEWSKFDQSVLSDQEARKIFDQYFAIFPWDKLPPSPEGFDMGCGTGRWARLVAPRVAKLHCVDPSDAIRVAECLLHAHKNIVFHNDSLDSTELRPNSQDFGYSIGVLHHIPDVALALRSCVDLLKPRAPFLVYIYYSFDNRPVWFRVIWKLSDLLRGIVHRSPPSIKNVITDVIASVVYWPLARMSGFLKNRGFIVDSIPLSFYKDHSFYTMRTDARDRFGTPLEQRFSRVQIEQMMLDAGLMGVQFSEDTPYWCAVGFKV
jgi:SAM-dependent methyltransferase